MSNKIKIKLDDPETRATWEAVLQAKEEVASWPAWKRGVERMTCEELHEQYEIALTKQDSPDFDESERELAEAYVVLYERLRLPKSNDPTEDT